MKIQPFNADIVNAGRFWSYVDRSGGPGACWPWLGARDPEGYGRFHTGESRNSCRLAHRVAFGLTNGFLPPAVRHDCDNPPCCNPAHHLPGERLDNNRDMIERGRHWAQRGSYQAARGSLSSQAKLTDEAVEAIRARYAAGQITQDGLSKEFGVCQRSISKIVRGVSYVNVQTRAI